jgi:hypothetical protein
VEETVARELELANRVDREAEEAIRVIQEGILDALREGKSFSTVHKEGGTNIRLPGDVFVFADYGESSDREEFASPEAFLARLRKFYDWESRRDWYPHPAPEIEVWKYIERKLM